MSQLQELKKIVERLRGPEGCPWDQEQTHESLCEHLVEEYSELLDTIDRKDMPHMREELGDVLLHVFLHAQMADEGGYFNIEDVAREINEKLIRRHPHVFGNIKIEGMDDVLTQWEAIKKEEKEKKKQASGKFFEDLPPRFPALLYARDVYKQVCKKGLADEVGVIKHEKYLTEEEAGRRLFELVVVCKASGIDPESALRRHVSGVVEEIEKRYGK